MVNVATIQGCTIQKYSYSPISKLVVSSVNDSPGPNNPVSNVSPKSAELVAVCAAESTLIHSTICPC